MYTVPTKAEPLAQGDILDACPVFDLEATATNVDLEAAPVRWRERVTDAYYPGI